MHNIKHTDNYLKIEMHISYAKLNFVGQERSVGIANHYGLEGLGIQSRWGQGFLHPFRLALGPNQSPIQSVSGLFPGGGRGQGVALTTHPI